MRSAGMVAKVQLEREGEVLARAADCTKTARLNFFQHLRFVITH